MNCKRARIEILKTDLVAGELPARVQDHVGSCDGCSRLVEEVRSLAQAMSGLDRPKLPGGFEQRLKARLDILAPRKERRWGWKPVLAVPAAALAAVLLLVIPRMVHRPGSPGIHVRYASIELIVEARDPVAGVEFSLVLPEGIEPFGGTGPGHQIVTHPSRMFRWNADLAEGENRYHLPVTLSGCGAFQVRAALSKGRDKVEAVLTMEVSPGGIQAIFSSARLPARSRFTVRLAGSRPGIRAKMGS